MNANITDPVWVQLTTVGLEILFQKCPEKAQKHMRDEDRIAKFTIGELLFYFGECFSPGLSYTKLPFKEIIEFTDPKEVETRINHWTT